MKVQLEEMYFLGTGKENTFEIPLRYFYPNVTITSPLMCQVFCSILASAYDHKHPRKLPTLTMLLAIQEKKALYAIC